MNINKIFSYILPLSKNDKKIINTLEQMGENYFFFGMKSDDSLITKKISEITNVSIFGDMGSGKTYGLHCFLFMWMLKNSSNTMILNLQDFDSYEWKCLKSFGDQYKSCNKSDYVNIQMNLYKEIEARNELFIQNNVSNIADYENKVGEKLTKIFIICDGNQPVFDDPSFFFNEKIKISEFKSQQRELVLNGHNFGIHFFIVSSYLMETLGIRHIDSSVNIVFKTSIERSILILNNKKSGYINLEDRGHFYCNFMEDLGRVPNMTKMNINYLLRVYYKPIISKNLYLSDDNMNHFYLENKKVVL